jgi:hypothetical protein
LLLNDGEIARDINDPLQAYREYLLLKYDLYKSQGVGAADFVQAAGTIGTVSCPGGPAVKTVRSELFVNQGRKSDLRELQKLTVRSQVIGRQDTTQAAPVGTLPEAFGSQSKQEVLIQLWADKGFSPRELAALMGAHSISRAAAQGANGIPIGSKTLAATTVSHVCEFWLT